MGPICKEVFKISSGGPEMGLVKLCDGLEQGVLENTNPKYEDLFTRLDPVCVDLLAFVDKKEKVMIYSHMLVA